MKKLAFLLIVGIALVGCGRESEQMDADATRAGEDVPTLTIAWHKVSDADGSICDLSTATEQSIEQASLELTRTLAPHGVKVEVKTLTPEKVEGSTCLCNRVLIQGRYIDEWLDAEVVKAPCSGCPNQSGCAGSGSACAGQTAMVHQGITYNIVPANLIVMAGMVAAADLTGEPISYNGCPGAGACNGDCTCGRCAGGCVEQVAGADCDPDCPGVAVGCTPACEGSRCAPASAQRAVAAPKQAACPRAAQCKEAGCPSKAAAGN
jgi:hypothetical protein